MANATTEPEPDLAALRAAYDRFRRAVVLPDARREEEGGVVTHVFPSGEALVTYAALDEDGVEAAIRRQQDLACHRGAPLEWTVCSHDRPVDLAQRLETQGFRLGASETILVAALGDVQIPGDIVDHDVRLITSPEAAAVADIWPQTWGGDAAAMAEGLARRLAERPETFGLFGAYVNGILAATGQVTYYPEQGFASLVRSATLPAYRRRGLYTALVAARIAAARAKGARYLDTEASPLSRPILERFGFHPIATAWTYAWEPV